MTFQECAGVGHICMQASQVLFAAVKKLRMWMSLGMMTASIYVGICVRMYVCVCMYVVGVSRVQDETCMGRVKLF